MVLNKNITFFILSVLVAVYVKARSISQIGDIRIEKDNDKWTCDMIECPPNTARCFVSKSNEENPSVLKRVNICYSKKKTILLQKNSSSAVDPHNEIRQYISSYANGAFVSFSDANAKDFDLEASNKQINSELEKLHSNLDNMRSNIENNVKNIGKFNLF